MPFEIVRNDITNMCVDAIVNAANPKAAVGYGVDAGIHKKAGARLFAARKKLGSIAVGEAAITPAYNLSAKYVIHAVGPVWRGGGHGEEALLSRCYQSALKLAREYGCESVAFPLLCAGNCGFPKSTALQTAVREFGAFLMENDMKIYLVVFGEESLALSEKLFHSVASYIDENYVREKTLDEYGLADMHNAPAACSMLLRRRFERRREELREEIVSFDMDDGIYTAPLAEMPPAPTVPSAVPTTAPIAAPFTAPKAMPLAAQNWESMLKNMDAGFSETLLRLIDKSGKKDSEIYKKANIDRKLFSKIRNNADYKPSKPTALAFAIALELDLDETRDFISRAGFALSHSSKFDIIVEYFILNRNYDVFELNEVLFAFDQPLIGA